MAIQVNNVLVAFDSMSTDKVSVQAAAAFSKSFGASCKAIHFSASAGDVKSLFTDQQNLKVEGGTDNPMKHISALLVDDETDLLVIPVNTITSGKGLFSFKDANKIIEHFERMVLTIPGNCIANDFSKIVVPIDSSHETRQKIPHAIAMAKRFHSTIHIVGVSSDTGKDAAAIINNYTRQVCDNIAEFGVSYTLDMRIGGNPTEATIEFAKEKKAGLILIMTEQETNLISIFTGKYSQQMIKQSDIPVLSVHPKDLVVSEARI